MMRIPEKVMPNNVAVPAISIGTYKVNDVESIIRAAFDSGIMAVDAAEHYHNEAQVGQALANIGLSRKSFYLSTKIWNEDHGYQKTLDAFDASVSRLQTEPDMLMIHWPCPMNHLYGETWKALQKIYSDGRVRAIGVSNFKIHHLEYLKKLGGVQPMVNQIEMHPFYIDFEMLQYAKENNILVEAWSPLLRGTKVISDPIIIRLAEKYNVSPAVLAIRYLIQYGVRVIIKSNNPLHVKENTGAFNFNISEEDIAQLQALNTGKRFFQDPDEYYL